ncbi:lipoprotein [Winslowiella iniecta]|uniref:Lipoprotein n=1 Tax=Winslowiella iniecta TaxID=1560201 RepID=A0A0L7TIC2_9GAMM|nr:lipoprotein [Winslowiella iniecta]KOC91878.1 lipoprotein [Winslowiella iniecta]KOC94996.1 lipoprotein [Winslowiella iniecta]
MNQALKVAVVALLLSGCALKQYPKSTPLGAQESATLDCPAIDNEMAKSQRVQQEIADTGKFSTLTVVGFMLDFGIGNGIAKYHASSKAEERLTQLRALKTVKCPQSS